MRSIGIIPARYSSTRLPGKPLALIGDKTMVRRVYEQAKMSRLNEVIVATDDMRIVDEVESFGGTAILTSRDHTSGTDRCAEAAKKSDLSGDDVIINIQGDEPFLSPDSINTLLDCFKDKDVVLATLAKKIENPSELDDPSVAKLVMANDGNVIYFSRTAIPYMRDIPKSEWLTKHTYLKHIGIYGYRSDTLSEISSLPQSSLEISEKLEQLRWLEHGRRIRAALVKEESFSIDTPEDLKRAQDSV